MSEYQYYEFQAIDRPLTEREMGELRQLSTRAEITPTSFTNEYHWGDFRGNPRKMMEKYFDAFLYYANWGSHWLMLRLPREVVDVKAAEQYDSGESLSVDAKGKHVLLEFHSEDESGDWDEDCPSLARLVPLRADLMGGDLRGLYLGWLNCLQMGELDDEEVEPPVPPGLGKLSASLRSLADFLRIDDGLLEAAAEADTAEPPPEASPQDREHWIRKLPAAEKEALLVQLIEGSVPHLGQQLLQRFRHDFTKAKPSRKAAQEGGRRTVGELTAAWHARAEDRRRREEEAKAKRREAEARKQAAERKKHLDALAARQPAAWKQVERLLATTSPKNYDEAVTLLVDLRDVAAGAGSAERFSARLGELRLRHAKKPSLLKRLEKRGLG
jgi:hypothetical protein